ncbi:MAG: RagB/SusD family nutrient uptake outer membrane protein [Chitinophagales bacterium]|nr:RagB/SusD family nutrient uptake outer membrane protein [Chitinophagales bacterium]MCZ2392474.1 RagB/SusD family nutrient uptake outer membrane protein [Chitinophagales bacterium]
MKKLSLLFIIAFSTLLFSCKDELELTPFDQLEEENAFNTPADFTSAIRGVYQRMLGEEDGDYYPRKMVLADVLSDNLILNQNGRKSLQNFYEFKLDANSTWGSGMFYAYSTIDRANRIIDNINNLKDDDFKNNILGQAKAVRALAHFDLATTFAPSFGNVDPDAANSGIPIKETVDASAKPSRNTLNQTFDFIINELKAAKDLLSNDRSMIASGFINKAATSALLARVYLYKGDYPAAKAEAIEAKGLAGTADQAIGSITEFPKIWKDNSVDNAGVLFKLLVRDQDRINVGAEYNQTAPATGTRSEYVPTFELYSLYDTTDVRYSAYFATSPFSGVLYNHVVKYISRPASNLGVVDVKVVRGAEIYLTLAEAAARTGDEATALEALNEVRSRRYSDYVAGNESGNALLSAVMKQRRLELAFEGFRFYDLKRLDLGIVRSATEGDNADGTGTPAPASTQNIAGKDFKFTLPVPTAERQVNPNFAQSPNY